MVLISKLGCNGSEPRDIHQRGEKCSSKGVLPFRYGCEPTGSGVTALAGLPAYLEMGVVSGLAVSIQRYLGVCALKEQGWTDTQVVMSLV